MPGEIETISALPRARASLFRTTHWTLVLDAARSTTECGVEAFARIYQDYRVPLYTFVRHRGFSPADAEDIIQDFFVCLIEKRRLAGLERNGGRFRSFLLTSLNHFLINAWSRDRSQKRGGGVPMLSLDTTESELQYGMATPAEETPESLFERQWIAALLDHVLRRLRAECEAAGKGPLFDDLQSYLQGDRHGLPYATVAARYGLKEGAVKVAVHRLRRRYGALLREEIRRTVSSAEEVDNELRHLIAVSAR